MLSTMVYADEVNEPDRDRARSPTSRTSSSPRRSSTWPRQLIASLSADFDADRFEDTYRNQVLDLIERKAAGDTEIVAPPEVMTEDKVVDLMAALEASVKEAKAARDPPPGRRPRADEEAAGAGEEAHPQERLGVARARARPARRDRRAPAQGHQPRQGALPGRGVHQGRGDRLLRPRRAGDAAAHRATAASRCGATRTASTSSRSSRSAARRTGRSGSARSPGPGDRNGTIGYCALDSGRGAGVVGQHGRPRDPRADGPRRRHRVAHDVRVRPRPGPRTGIPECAEVALDIREVLDNLAGLECLAKTSGSKGLQLYVPLNTPHTHEHCSEFAQAVAQVLEKHHPKRVTSTMAKSGPARQGVHRLEPEQPPQDDRRRLLAASPAAPDGVARR